MPRDKHERPFWTASITITLAALAAAPRLQSQDSESRPPDSNLTIKTTSHLVQMAVSVERKTDRQAIPGLSENDFALYVDGRRKRISSFIQGERRPIKLMFLIETSESQVKAVDGLSKLLPEALRALPATDKVGVATVFPKCNVLLEPTLNRALIPSTFDQVRREQARYIEAKKSPDKRQRPKFDFDDLTRALAEISKKESDRSNETELVLVIVTDDFDLLDPKLSGETSRQLLRDGTLVAAFIDTENGGIAFAKDYVHTVRTVTPLRFGMRDHGSSFFAEQTGGPVIEVQNREYLAALQRLLKTISSPYLIGFAPDPQDLDGKFHKIRLKLVQPVLRAQATVSCREGFWATP